MSEETNSSDFLSTEYNYLAHFAFQSSEDRAGIGLLYLLTVGSIMAAFIATGLESIDLQFTAYSFAGIFILLSVFAILTFLKLIRLRQAWHDSISAMAQLKAYYTGQGTAERKEEAFAWSAATIPPRSKAWSLTFLTALQIALAGGATMALAVVFFGLGLVQSLEVWLWVIAILVAVIYIVDLLIVYWWLLRDKK